MRDFNTQIEQIQLLIDRIQYQFINGLKMDKSNYEKLLSLSEDFDYAYGQARAHVYLTQYYHVIQEDKEYFFHLDRAKHIAEGKNYFDVLIECYSIEGSRNISVCDEMAAFSMYLKGLQLAFEINDKKACAVFYNNIGDLYCEIGAYKDAEKFYRMALELLEDMNTRSAVPYRKRTLINLIHLFCIQGKLEQAKSYQESCHIMKWETGRLSVLFAVEEIEILLLENRREEALKKIEEARAYLLRSRGEDLLLQAVYVEFMRVLLHAKDEATGAWCIGRILKFYKGTHQNIALQICKLRIEYAAAFDLDQDDIYEEFYETALIGERKSKFSTAESIKSLMAIYDINKEQKRVLAEQSHLQEAVNMDELTKLYNRRYFSKLVSKLVRDGQVESLGCIIVDVDFFKEYNDCYGHQKGDDALREIAFLLSDNLPEHTYAARYGGDEFLCLFPGKSEDEMTAYIERVQEKLKEKHIYHEKNKAFGVLTVSFGAYRDVNPKDCDEFKLIQKADQALYQAKRKGRNTYAVYSQRRKGE